MTDILFIGDAADAPDAVKKIEFLPDEIVVTFNNGLIKRYPNRDRKKEKKD